MRTWTDPLRPADLDPDGPVAVETWLGAPALSYPRRPRTVVDVLDRAVRLHPSAPAFVDTDGTRTTYADFADRVEGTAAALTGLGVGPGDRVAVAARNGLGLAVLLFACARAGTVLVGLDPRLAPPQWEWILGHSRASLAVAAPALRAPLLQAGAGTVLDLGELTGTAATWRGGSAPGPDSTAYAVVYTSGTTGRPKASKVVHRCSVHSGMSYQRVLQLEPGETTAVLFPLTYISAMHAHVLPAMLAGASCVLVDTTSPARFLDVLAEHQIGWAYSVPSMWQLALRLPGLSDQRLPALRRLGAGGSPLPAGLVAGLRSRLPRTRLYDVYGLSETHSPAAILRDEEFADHAGTVGRPLPCMEAQVRSERGEVLPAGEAGQLWLRGSLVTTGYADDPQATARAIVDGWFDTGDVARVDADGFVTVLDRTKDMINRGGTKVFSAQVEEVLRTHPGVEDAAVVGAPDPVAGEQVVAFVVPRPGVALEVGSVREHVRAQLAGHAVPRHVHLLDVLPRNPVGKTDKPALRARLSG